MKRTKRTNEEWMDLIRECKCSGLSDQIWLRENHIPASSYYKKYKELCGVVEESAPLPEKHLPEIPETHEIVQVTFEYTGDGRFFLIFYAKVTEKTIQQMDFRNKKKARRRKRHAWAGRKQKLRF